MSSNTTQYEALAEQIESILQDPKSTTAQIKDKGTHRHLIKGGRNLAASLEQPRDTAHRIGYSICRTALSRLCS